MLVVDDSICICILDIIMDIIMEFSYYFYDVIMLLLWILDIFYITNFRYCYCEL